MNTIAEQPECEGNKEERMSNKFLQHLMSQYNMFKKEERKNALEDLPASVLKRIGALEKLQIASISLDCEFHQEIYQLERKFESKQNEIFAKRSDIVNGKYEPTEEECLVPQCIQGRVRGREIDGATEIEGVPSFWLTVIKNNADLCDMIKNCDEPILRVNLKL